MIGFCKVKKKKGDKDNHVDALYLKKEHRGKGVAKNLMERAFSFLGERKGIQLEVASYNARAKSMYQRYGFVEMRIEYFPMPNIEKTCHLQLCSVPQKTDKRAANTATYRSSSR